MSNISQWLTVLIRYATRAEQTAADFQRDFGNTARAIFERFLRHVIGHRETATTFGADHLESFIASV